MEEKELTEEEKKRVKEYFDNLKHTISIKKVLKDLYMDQQLDGIFIPINFEPVEKKENKQLGWNKND